jgi:hypothetical protein
LVLFWGGCHDPSSVLLFPIPIIPFSPTFATLILSPTWQNIRA